MFKLHALGKYFWILAALAMLQPGIAFSQDRDTQEIQRYVLTEAALAKYKQAARKLATLPAEATGACDDGDAAQSIAEVAARLDAVPAAKSAITSAGMTTREYVVFSFSLINNGLAAWAVSQPGGKLPPGTSQANVDFYKRHAAELESLPTSNEDSCNEEEAAEDDYSE